jgi:hypothetical protein
MAEMRLGIPEGSVLKDVDASLSKMTKKLQVLALLEPLVELPPVVSLRRT